MSISPAWRYPALLPLSWLYSGMVRLRNWCYERKIFRTVRLSATVVSIGNLSVGGTGKTPTTALLANALVHCGLRVAIVARGYRRKDKDACIVSDGRGARAGLPNAGDEPLLLAQQCPQVPIVVARSKTRAAQVAVEKFRPEIILVDDGMQHRRLQRDLEMVLLPASLMSPPAWLLPAGPLREPWSGLRRAQAIGITGVADLTAAQKNDLYHFISQRSPAPIVLLDFVADHLASLRDDGNLPMAQLAQAKVLLVSGIAAPQRFHRMAADLGAQIAGEIVYRDHHNYTRTDAGAIAKCFQNSNADLIITTAKDGIKLRLFESLLKLPVFILEIRARILPENLSALVSMMIEASKKASQKPRF